MSVETRVLSELLWAYLFLGNGENVLLTRSCNGSATHCNCQILGLEVVMSTKTRGHVLTFRCVNCGSNEALAYRSCQDPLPTDELRTRIYQATCTACGWKSTVCGEAALKIEFNESQAKPNTTKKRGPFR